MTTTRFRCRCASVLLAVAALASLGAGTWTNQATTCTAASYAALPAGKAQGTLCQDTSTGGVWCYLATPGIWVPPRMCGGTIVSYLDGSTLPASAVPAWTTGGTQTQAVAAGVLTVTDTSTADTRWYELVDAVNFAAGKNIAMIARVQVTAAAGGLNTTPGWRSYLCIRPGALNAGCLSLAYNNSDANADSDPQAFYSNGGGAVVGDRTGVVESPAPSILKNAYNIYIWSFNPTTSMFELQMGGNPYVTYFYGIAKFTTFGCTAASVGFGTATAEKSTQNYDYVVTLAW